MTLLLYPTLLGKDLATSFISKPIRHGTDEFSVVFRFDILEDRVEFIDEQFVTLSLPFIDSQSEYESICVQRIVISENATLTPPKILRSENTDYASTWERNKVYYFDDLCLKHDLFSLSNEDLSKVIVYENEESSNLSRRTGTIDSYYYYPFDRMEMDIQVEIYGQTTDLEGNLKEAVFRPKLLGFVDAPNWEEQIEIATPNRILIGFWRPIPKQILTIVLLGSIGTFITILVFLKEPGSFLEVSVGILLGLWGIQSLLVPPNFSSRT